LDTLTIALCLCVGSAVAWLIALYTEGGAYLLFWNVLFGMVGAALCALAVTWVDPAFAVAGVVTVGPVCAWLAIVAGQAIRRAL
jgi:hypothetical protein